MANGPRPELGVARGSARERINAEFWRSTADVAAYDNRVLLPAEVVILTRYHEVIGGRVLELGCGAGRLLGYLSQLSRTASGIDISAAMVDRCNRSYPLAHARVGDIAALDTGPKLTYDAVFAINNVLDVFDDALRRKVLGDIRELIEPRGLFILSAHNLASLEPGESAASPAAGRAASLLGKVASSTPAGLLRGAARIPARRRNRRRLAAFEYRGADYAIVNDTAHDYSLLHYYIGREAQERQLTEAGFELVECLGVNGESSAALSRDPWLHYVARPSQ